MVPLVGSGKFVTMAVVAEDGQPLEESSVENQGWLVKTAITDKRVLQWMLVLSQIGITHQISLCSLAFCLSIRIQNSEICKCSLKNANMVKFCCRPRCC